MNTIAMSLAILQWDQETYMPSGAIEERSEQLAYLEGVLHRKITNQEIGDILGSLGADEDHLSGSEELEDIERGLVRETYRRYIRETKLPESLVVELAKQTSLSQAIWAEARKKADFKQFAPSLETLTSLLKEKAEHYGYEDHIYDALMDDFEPWMSTKEVAEIFDGLGSWLSDFVDRIRGSRQVDNSFLSRVFLVEGQKNFGEGVLKDIGFDLHRGRMDLSTHPFTTRLGRNDVRLTTRYNENFFQTGIFSTIHEAGHGLYELGFDDDIQDTILADGASLGIHESQSRFWENMIGRGLAFWKRYLPKLAECFPNQLTGVSPDAFYRAVNKVEPSYIRVEADEVTYGLHIILRFDLERALLTDEIKVSELPMVWNEKMKQLLGITPKNDAEGVLQDIHWSLGAMGYFPTYALGNLYAAQFAETLRGELVDLDRIVNSGDFRQILDWLRNRIHKHGKVYTARELCTRVTGKPLDPSFFTNYLEEKYKGVYDM